MSNRRRLRTTPSPTTQQAPAQPDERDPVVKYDGNGRPVRLSETGVDRAERRRWARNHRRAS